MEQLSLWEQWGLLEKRAKEEIITLIARLSDLSDREQEVIRHFLLGASRKEIAGLMGLSNQNVYATLSNARKKIVLNKEVIVNQLE